MQIDKEFQTLLAPLSNEELAGLEQDILRDGCRVPLDVWQGILVDGHNRYSICTKHDLPYSTVEREFDDREAVKTWIIRNQLNRRNLKPNEVSYLRGKLYEQADKKQGARTDLTSAKNLQKSTAERIAEQYGVTGTTIRNDAAFAAAVDTLAEATSAEMRQQILTGDLPVTKSDVVALATLPVEEQQEIVAKGEAEILKAAKEIRAKKAQANAQARAEIKAQALPLPDGQYQCLVIDPPWPIEKIERDERPNQVGLDYPTMTIEELAALPVQDLAGDNCHLYLWTTHKFLPDALKLAEAWGFRYQCLMTWIKNVGFTPFSWMYSTEHVLFCRRGTLPLEKLGMRLDFHAKVREHSRKPDEFYNLVAQASSGPRLDMFSREARDGFEQWGLEIQKFKETV